LIVYVEPSAVIVNAEPSSGAVVVYDVSLVSYHGPPPHRKPNGTPQLK
jgi:hypothetical protein